MTFSHNDQLLSANAKHYYTSDVVKNYLKNFLQARRVEVALSLLHKSVEEQFGDLPKKDIKILDLAASGGDIAQQIAQEGFQVTAADIEAHALENIQQKNTQIQTMLLNASTHFSIEEGSYHALFMGELIEHIFDTRLLLQECYRILKPKGVLVLTTPNLATLHDRLAFLFGYPPAQVAPLHSHRYLHIRPFNYRLLSDALQEAGFQKLELHSNHVEIKLPTGKKVYSSQLAKWFPTIGKSLIMAGVK